jgi:hypothetical protein
MKTFLSDIFPRIQRYSEKLDNLTLLANQHWVSIDEIYSNKIVYIFRTNNELLVSTNGIVESLKWEYIGNKSLIIEKSENKYLFKHGFFDENILALKLDSTEEYAVFVNENKYDGELNSIDRVFDFLKSKYLNPLIKTTIETSTREIINTDDIEPQKKYIQIETDKGIIELEPYNNLNGTKAYLEGKPAPDGKYKLNWWEYFLIKDGLIIKS